MGLTILGLYLRYPSRISNNGTFYWALPGESERRFVESKWKSNDLDSPNARHYKLTDYT